MTACMMRIRKVQEVSIQDLGQKIKAARKALLGIKSLEEICDECELSRTYWYDVENDNIKGALSVENLRKIEKALGVDFGVKFD
jgi:transcriptional regulator with XRE-family HTH domain